MELSDETFPIPDEGAHGEVQAEMSPTNNGALWGLNGGLCCYLGRGIPLLTGWAPRINLIGKPRRSKWLIRTMVPVGS